ncbi:hypothetical protein PHSY_005003 [Pseudozyma hubeiensis SY62]|uniref:Uncharacterized protein n=1 Tax=Pseudozyma hubeiensis (strain SY62) TaxID=1305764 RepID=R9P850_PSEHS|nr:hypothetical protein PHSY_005003 [Pseudozyma hubeiensis SY62]GAC97417.1 hypothetical protein PHSY_005003 [Pseudozyma hubeiensis SY62]
MLLLMTTSVMSYLIHPDAVIWRSGQTIEEGVSGLQERIVQAMQANPSKFSRLNFGHDRIRTDHGNISQMLRLRAPMPHRASSTTGTNKVDSRRVWYQMVNFKRLFLLLSVATTLADSVKSYVIPNDDIIWKAGTPIPEAIEQLKRRAVEVLQQNPDLHNPPMDTFSQFFHDMQLIGRMCKSAQLE